MAESTQQSEERRSDELTDNHKAMFDYLISLADSCLVLGHRMSEWAGHGPMLEEDIALSNLGLDLLGQARSLYTYAASIEGEGRDEDQLAYFRDATSYRNLLIAEQPNGDFAFTMVRHLFFSVHFLGLWQSASESTDATLSAIAAKAHKELKYHQRHSAEWVIRLGDGTEESHQRAQAAVDSLWSFTAEMFDVLPSDRSLIDAGVIPDPESWKNNWQQRVSSILTEATLLIPADTGRRTIGRSGGRQGQHTEHLGYLLAEMQYLQRTYPGASW